MTLLDAAGARLDRLSRPWVRRGVAILLGVAMTSGQAPYGLWFVFLPATFLLFALHAISQSPREAGWLGWMAGVGYFASGLYWIAEAFLVDIARHGWMAPFAIAFMAAGLALFWALPFWAAMRWRRTGLSAVIVLAACWTLSEYARSHVLTGFPWALSSYVWTDTPVAQLSSVTGPHGLGFLILVLVGAFGSLTRSLRGILIPAVSVAILAGVWVWGASRLETPVPIREDGFRVRLVQPNAPQNEKWRSDRIPIFFDRLRGMTAAPDRPPLVVWPETAVPYLVENDSAAREVIAAVSGDANVILGARRVATGANGIDRWSNALLMLGGSGDVVATYDKHHLVPFGEYVPLGRILGALGLGSLTGGSFAAGPGPQIVQSGGVPPFLALICYESIFPHEMTTAPRAQWILQITNDAWFGSSAGPHQHFAQARMRAIEQGLPLARSANTGISAMIDPFGRVLVMQPLLSQGYVDADLPAALPATFYARTGDLPWIALIIFTLVGGVLRRH